MNNRIKQLRKALGLTQDIFGQQIGIMRNTVAGYESGARNPSNGTITSICREFNANEVWLRTGDGKMFNELSDEDELGAYLGKIGSGKYPRIEKMIKAYFRLPDEAQHAIDLYLDTLMLPDNEKKEQD